MADLPMKLLATCVVGMVGMWRATALCAAAPDDCAETDQIRQQVVGHFAAAFVHDDPVGIAAASTPDITWTIPGSSRVSGQRTGRDAVAALANDFATYDVHITVGAYTFGRDTVAVELHDTGSHDGQTLDQNVVNVLSIRNGEVANVEEHLADVSAFDAYFA